MAYLPAHILDAFGWNGENVKVVQELMRHSKAWTTLDLYTQARLVAKRQAQKRVVECLFAESPEPLPRAILDRGISD
jgi:flavorubredoxin